jgi:hypothetical protein
LSAANVEVDNKKIEVKARFNNLEFIDVTFM